MIGTGMLAIPILSGSAAYAVKDFFGLKGELSDKPGTDLPFTRSSVFRRSPAWLSTC